MDIQLDKPRRIEWTMRALRTFKERTGKSLLTDGLVKAEEEELFELTYAGLKGGDKHLDLTDEDLEDYFTLSIGMEVLADFSDNATGNVEPVKK